MIFRVIHKCGCYFWLNKCPWLRLQYNISGEVSSCFGQETANRPFGLRANLPPVYLTRWRLHTVLFIAELQARKLWMLVFIVFGLTTGNWTWNTVPKAHTFNRVNNAYRIKRWLIITKTRQFSRFLFDRRRDRKQFHTSGQRTTRVRGDSPYQCNQRSCDVSKFCCFSFFRRCVWRHCEMTQQYVSEAWYDSDVKLLQSCIEKKAIYKLCDLRHNFLFNATGIVPRIR